jgi:hypothetical protein
VNVSIGHIRNMERYPVVELEINPIGIGRHMPATLLR